MSSVVLQAETLNLPEIFAFKMRGKNVELTERGDSIMITPVVNPIDIACEMQKSDAHAFDRFLGQKHPGKELVIPFGELPDIFLNPVISNNFQIYSREELNGR